MSFVSSLLRPRHTLTVEQQHAIERWRELPRPRLTEPLDAARFVVVDVETTGLDIRNDRLLSIGAVIVERSAMVIGSTLEVVVRQPAPSADDNILVHRIGGTEQMSGVEPADALLAFLDFAGKYPIVGFNAGFDRTMIDRALRELLRVRTDSAWIDTSPLARALLPDRIPPEQTLDAWCAVTRIDNYQRHRALADALATAQLLLVLLDAAARRDIDTVAQLVELEKDQRWLERIGAGKR